MNMSDQSGNSGTPPADPIANLKAANDSLTTQLNNLKAELNRKVSNLETRIPQPVKVQQPEESLEDLIYTNPKKVIETIEERVNRGVDAKLNAQTRHTQVIGDLMYDFPELQDKNSELFKEAVSNYNSLSPEEQNSPSAYKLAVKDAALNLGVRPRSKRSEDDDFMVSGSGSSAGQSRKRSREGDLSDETLAFAQKVGFNIDDPKVVERIKARAQRRNWNKYE